MKKSLIILLSILSLFNLSAVTPEAKAIFINDSFKDIQLSHDTYFFMADEYSVVIANKSTNIIEYYLDNFNYHYFGLSKDKRFFIAATHFKVEIVDFRSHRIERFIMPESDTLWGRYGATGYFKIVDNILTAYHIDYIGEYHRQTIDLEKLHLLDSETNVFPPESMADTYTPFIERVYKNNYSRRFSQNRGEDIEYKGLSFNGLPVFSASQEYVPMGPGKLVTVKAPTRNSYLEWKRCSDIERHNFKPFLSSGYYSDLYKISLELDDNHYTLLIKESDAMGGSICELYVIHDDQLEYKRSYETDFDNPLPTDLALVRPEGYVIFTVNNSSIIYKISAMSEIKSPSTILALSSNYETCTLLDSKTNKIGVYSFPDFQFLRFLDTNSMNEVQFETIKKYNILDLSVDEYTYLPIRNGISGYANEDLSTKAFTFFISGKNFICVDHHSGYYGGNSVQPEWLFFKVGNSLFTSMAMSPYLDNLKYIKKMTTEITDAVKEVDEHFVIVNGDNQVIYKNDLETIITKLYNHQGLIILEKNDEVYKVQTASGLVGYVIKEAIQF